MAYWLDEGFWGWPEVIQAGTSAAGLYTRCGSYIAGNIERLRDAVVPADVARMLGTPEWVQRLVDAGLWVAEEAGYRDMRYFDLNPTIEVVERRKAQHAARQARYAAKRRQRISDAPADASVTSPPSLKRRGAGGGYLPHPYNPNGTGCADCTLPENNGVHRARGRAS